MQHAHGQRSQTVRCSQPYHLSLGLSKSPYLQEPQISDTQYLDGSKSDMISNIPRRIRKLWQLIRRQLIFISELNGRWKKERWRISSICITPRRRDLVFSNYHALTIEAFTPTQHFLFEADIQFKLRLPPKHNVPRKLTYRSSVLCLL